MTTPSNSAPVSASWDFVKPTPGPLRFSMSSGAWPQAVREDGTPVFRCDHVCTVYGQREVDMLRAVTVWNACEGLGLPHDAPPGILALIVAEIRDYSASPARKLTELRDLVAKLSAGTPGPAPVSPALPEAIRAAFEEVRRYHPEVCRVRFLPEGWEFTTPEGDAPEFSSKVDTRILEKALDWIYSNFVYPTSFEYQEAAPVSAEIPPDRRPVWSFEVDGTHVRWCGTLEQFHADCTAYVDASQGTWENRGRRHLVFTDSGDKTKTHFRAVAAK